MHWVAPSEKDTASATLEKHLWDAADQFRANSGLKAQEYSAGSPQGPVLGLIFLRMYEYLTAELTMIEGQGDWLKFDLPYPKSDFRSVLDFSLPNWNSHRLSIHGVETTDETVRHCRSHLAFAN
jgi:hypothetical protein